VAVHLNQEQLTTVITNTIRRFQEIKNQVNSYKTGGVEARLVEILTG